MELLGRPIGTIVYSKASYRPSIPYSGKLSREKTLQIGEKYNFCRENFHRLLAFTVPKDATPPNFVDKTLRNSLKFSPSKFFCYMVFPIHFVSGRRTS